MIAARLRDMFANMVIAKNADLIGHYYHPDFVMYSDGMSQSFAEFAESHRGVYATDVSYAIAYDDEAWVEGNDYLDGRIHRIWETTWPSWRNVAALADY